MATAALDIQDARATATTLRVARTALVEGLTRVVGVLAGKVTIPALAGVLIEAEPTTARLRFSGTDLDRWLTTTVPAECTGAVRLLLPAKRLLDVVKAFPAGQLVTITVERADGRKVTLTAGRAKATLLGMAVEEFPTDRPFTAEPITGLSAGTLAAALGRVAFAASDEESRPILNSVCLAGRADGLWAMATDQRQFARVRIAGREAVPAALVGRDVLLPPAAVATLMRAFPPETPVAMRLSEERAAIVTVGAVGAAWDGTSLATRLIEGPYPDLDRVIPRAEAATRVFEVDRTALAETLRRVLTVANQFRRVILRAASPDELQLSTSAPDAGGIDDSIAANYTSKVDDPESGWRIAFNGTYLLNMLALYTSETVRIACTTEGHAALFLDPTDTTGAVLGLVMPLRVED